MRGKEKRTDQGSESKPLLLPGERVFLSFSMENSPCNGRGWKGTGRFFELRRGQSPFDTRPKVVIDDGCDARPSKSERLRGGEEKETKGLTKTALKNQEEGDTRFARLTRLNGRIVEEGIL